MRPSPGAGSSCRRLAALAALLAALAACAPALAPVPVVTMPRHPDFVFPATPPALTTRALVLRQQRGWQFLQGGDTNGARREFTAALRVNPRFYPADAGLAYASLADRDFAGAVARFDRVLQAAPGYVPALVGRGDALVGESRADEAIEAFQAALAEDPALGDVRRRLDVLLLRHQQESLAAARRAAEAGQYDAAAKAYEKAIAASPDSAFLYRELAGVERRPEQRQDALAHLQKAAALDPSDARTYVQMGQLLQDDSRFDAAAEAYAKALALEPSAETAARLAQAREKAALARLPEEYSAIAGAPQVTRGDLAALIGVRLGALLDTAPRRIDIVLTDARGHWASKWIMAVVSAGVMEPYPNHTFQPRVVVRRLELAQVVSRLLTLAAASRPGGTAAWRAARPQFSDLPATHLGYPAAAAAVAAGVMSAADGAFRPGRPVAGAEAIDVMTRFERLAR